MSEKETKKEKSDVEKEDTPEGFEVLAEWTIRRLRPLQDFTEEEFPEKVKRWVLFSLGLDKQHQDIFLYLQENFRCTSTDIAKEFGLSPNTARKYLDELHTVGLVDYVGREYTLTYESLSRAIELMLVPRITDTLRTIARGASSSDRTYLRSFPAMPPIPLVPSPEGAEVIQERGVTQINRRLLESWYSQGKKVEVKSYGGLTITNDVDPDLLDSVIERIVCHGGLKIPTEVYTRISHKIRTYGGVETYD